MNSNEPPSPTDHPQPNGASSPLDATIATNAPRLITAGRFVLTTQQRNIVNLINTGHTTPQIARCLNTTPESIARTLIEAYWQAYRYGQQERFHALFSNPKPKGA